ncbi:MAG: RNA-protein complex protein Nop10 [Candidatus Thermoplasmatota archaeon]|jgi:H/ACA ribonucleoprotein complex subunit 3|nr:RNA-protein complex protein Nop10 [Candidatus Thermoplasmatota archaeon]MCL5790959.1 RNA-protein complex protein Nop10 [Candidatus Thermoplasmatota archaeon]
MKGVIRKCPVCGLYTLKDECPKCQKSTVVAGPPKYSTSDRFQKYRLEELEKI